MTLLTLQLSPSNSHPRPTPPVLSPHTLWLSVSQGYLTLTLTLTRGDLSPPHSYPHPKALPTQQLSSPHAPSALTPHPVALVPRLPNPNPNPNPNPRRSIPTTWLSSLLGSPTQQLSSPHAPGALTPHPVALRVSKLPNPNPNTNPNPDPNPMRSIPTTRLSSP